MTAERGGSDITRHWRLKTARNQILATECPETGKVVIASSSLSTYQPKKEGYVFEPEELDKDTVCLSKAAR